MTNSPSGIQDRLTRPGGLARQLQAARGDRTATEMAAQAGWQISKISKIEHGRQLPSPEDLDKWAEITGTDAGTLHEWQALLVAALEARRDYASKTRAGQRDLQREYNEVMAEAKHFRLFETTFVPRFLQLPEYTRAVLTESKERHGGADDIDAAVAERQASLSWLYEPTRRFEFIITEPVLGWRFEALPLDVHRAQLDRLLYATGLPNVRFGIVPLFQPIGWVPQNSFQLFDDVGATEHWLGEVEYRLAEEIEKLDRVMAKLWESAREGDQAREIIKRALDRLDPAAH